MKNVLLIDSGSGGVNILKECVKVCPYCNYLLFCDDLNLPYGSKTKEKLQEITTRNLTNIKGFFNFDVVILACNTLTCTCLEHVRKVFPDVIFIGTVPAVKPAIERFKEEDVLVLATPVTIKHNVIINKHAVKTLALENLARDIDAHLDELEVLEDGIKAELKDFKTFIPKAVVLGCTHYVAVENILKKILGDNVTFFNSANGVARRLKYFVDMEAEEKGYQVQIMVSGNQNNLAKFWWWFKN